MFGTITVEELKTLRESGASFRLIDVREPNEYQFCHIEGAELMPLGRIGVWAGNLDPNEELVLLCHHGMRSQRACMMLAGQGFTKVKNLVGGIEQWSLRVDPGIPRY